MNIGLLGNTNMVLKRKFRWVALMWCYDDPYSLTILNNRIVTVRKRPTVNVNDDGTAATWEPFQFGMECENANDNKNLYEYLSKCYDFTAPDTHKPEMPEATLKITMLDEVGEPKEEWLMTKVWPTSINFGELDFSSSEVATIELTVRYSSCRYRSLDSVEIEID